MKGLKNIQISQQLVDWAHELDRYYFGDLQQADSADWLRNVDRLNQQIVSEFRRVVSEQLPRPESEGVTKK